MKTSTHARADAVGRADDSETYEQWLAWASADDQRRGLDLWKREEPSDLYDHRVIRSRFDELVQTRKQGNAQDLLFYLNEGLHGNMGGMGSPRLYARAKVGTKELITRYIDELVAALEDFEHLDDRLIGPQTKWQYFNRARGCFGRSALMFSGAGSLGPFHIGVAKALAEQHLLPEVISGSSAGSMVAAVIGTQPRHKLPGLLVEVSDMMQHQGGKGDSSIWGMPRVLRQSDVNALIREAIPDMTFLEAYETTGCAINISVAPSRLHQRSRLLNAITSPNALIREAVLASCAVPGVFAPVTLFARNAEGGRQPYVPSRKWIDGSLSEDLPARRLARLYGVNHFISSQTNPLVFWMLQDQMGEADPFARWATLYQSAVRDWLRAVYPFVMDSVRGVYPINLYTRALFGVATQEYTADINILPQQRAFDPTRLLSPLSGQETRALITEGERATWPKIEMIRNCTKVSRQIDGALRRLGDSQATN